MGEIEDLRRDVDRVDDRLLELLLKRAKLSQKIGEIKNKQNIDIENKEREAIILKKIDDFCEKNNLNKKQIEDIYKKILDFSKKIQEAQK